MIEYTDEQIKEQRRIFNLFFAKYGQYDYCVYIRDFGRYKITNWDSGWYRQRCYHDGAWLEGYDLEEVIYWGA